MGGKSDFSTGNPSHVGSKKHFTPLDDSETSAGFFFLFPWKNNNGISLAVIKRVNYCWHISKIIRKNAWGKIVLNKRKFGFHWNDGLSTANPGVWRYKTPFLLLLIQRNPRSINVYCQEVNYYDGERIRGCIFYRPTFGMGFTNQGKKESLESEKLNLPEFFIFQFRKFLED